MLQLFAPIITPTVWIGSSEDRSPCIQCGVDASLCERNGLLFHGLVDGDLVLTIHFVKLIYAAYPVIRQH